MFVGELPVVASLLEKASRARTTDRADRTTLWKAFDRMMARRRAPAAAGAGERRHAGGCANARERGAEGIGLCRTEHMFLGEERVHWSCAR